MPAVDADVIFVTEGRDREINARCAIRARLSFGVFDRIREMSTDVRNWTLLIDGDRGTPRGAPPPTPPGILVTYHGGSTGLSLDRDMELGKPIELK